jgi:inward rectifier potassium channel
MRTSLELPLVRDRNPMFALTWTVMHRIDEDSPFFGTRALDRLRDERAELYVSVSGLDETSMQTIHARRRYLPEEIVEDAYSVDVLVTDPAGTRTIDYDRFHEVVTTGEEASRPRASSRKLR